MKYLPISVAVALGLACVSIACGSTAPGSPGDAGTAVDDAAIEAASSVDASEAGSFDANTGDACTPACTYNGQAYCTGAVFKAVDGCNDCGCSEEGNVACTKRACIDAGTD